MRICGTVKQILVIPPKGRRLNGREQIRTCYDVRVWTEGVEAYQRSMAMAKNSLPTRIGEAVFDDFVDSFDGRGSFDISENYEVAPVLLDCLVVASVGTRDGNRILSTNSRLHSSIVHGNEVIYGILIRDVQGSSGTETYCVSFFRGDEGFSAYFDGVPMTELDFM